MASRGVNKPLSTAGPTPKDRRVDTELEAFLQANDIYETAEGDERRARIILELESMLRAWVISVGERKGIIKAGQYGPIEGAGQLHVFGSQRLGVHGPDSDVDVLCICPQFISRSEFFISFCSVLKESQHSNMVLAVPEAYTPVVKFNYRDQPVDMIFVSLPMLSIPGDIDLLDDVLLKDQDEKGVRSLNGVRVAQYLINSVPNFPVFRSALRAVKFWGRRRGIYSNVLGFLGGINFALLVAFICQLHPNTCPACIVQRFFKIYFHWTWPNPILIAPPVDYQLGHLNSWNYVNHMKDRADLMPIITPAFPQMNSAYNISLPQFRVIQEEIMRGYQLVNRWPKESSLDTWVELFTPGMPNFLNKFPRYAQIDIISTSGESNHRRWFSWCESRVRLLIRGIELPNMIFCHPITNCYHRKASLNEEEQANIVLNPLGNATTGSGTTVLPISYSSAVSRNISAAPAATPAPEKYTSTFFIGLTFSNGLRSVDLTSTIQDFVYRVSIFDGKTSDMSVSVKALEPSSLPEFALDMYEDSANIKMTPMKTPSRQRLENTAALSPPSMVIPASAMSIVQSADKAIAPAMGSSSRIAKTLWSESDTVSEVPVQHEVAGFSVEEEGWVDADIQPCDAAIVGQGRRRDRAEFGKGSSASDLLQVPPIDVERSRAMSFDGNSNIGCDDDDQEDISPFKKSRAERTAGCQS